MKLGASQLPKGPPAGRGLSLDLDLVGPHTFAKPVQQESDFDRPQPPPENNLHDLSTLAPRDLTHDKYVEPKTLYPYRQGFPPQNRDKRASFVVGMWLLRTAPEALVTLSMGQHQAVTSLEILADIDPKILEKGSTCKATLKRSDGKNLRWIFSVDCGNGAYVVRLKAKRPRKNTVDFKKMDMYVSCSCPAWQWQGPEYHAKTKGYLDGKPRGTASTPDIRDPQRTHKLCKHVVAVLKIASQWKLYPKK